MTSTYCVWPQVLTRVQFHSLLGAFNSIDVLVSQTLQCGGAKGWSGLYKEVGKGAVIWLIIRNITAVKDNNRKGGMRQKYISRNLNGARMQVIEY